MFRIYTVIDDTNKYLILKQYLPAFLQTGNTTKCVRNNYTARNYNSNTGEHFGATARMGLQGHRDVNKDNFTKVDRDVRLQLLFFFFFWSATNIRHIK